MKAGRASVLITGANTATARRRRTFMVAGLAWLAAVSIGLGWMARYENSPGTVRAALKEFPAASVIPREPGTFALLMMIHPHCPCSRASLGELEKVMARCGGRMRAQVLCYKPEGSGDEWAQTDLWRSAAAIPGVQVSADEGGREAARFGGETSGHTVLFDAAGRLLFQGGITASRGHAGDNTGSDAVLALVNGMAAPGMSHVFGCPIQDDRSVQTAGKERTQ
jgi:hypothetical protein